MRKTQIAKCNSLMKRREQLANFVYVSNFSIFTDSGIILDAAVNVAIDTINKIDSEIAKLMRE